MNFSTTLLLILAFIAANLPFLAERIFFVIRPKTGHKNFGWRLLELVVLFFAVGGIARLLESNLGDIQHQDWQFYAVNASLFVVFAYPGFVYRYLWPQQRARVGSAIRERQSEVQMTPPSSMPGHAPESSSAYSDLVRKSFNAMDAEELQSRINSGILTEEARGLAIEELKSRGLAVPDQTQEKSLSSIDKVEQGFFWRCWHGKERLWKAFWLLGLLVGFVFGVATIPPSHTIRAVLVLLVAMPLQVFWWVSVWRCAFRSSHWAWAVLARGHVIVGITASFFLILRAFT